jgi:DNA repair exonuclease SbcCD ATPase subunit
MKFIDEIEKELNYPFKGIISDMQENIIYSLSLKKPEIPHQFCKTHILRGIDRVLKILPYHNQLSKLLKKLRSLKSAFIHPYSIKKQSLLKELKDTQNKIANLKRKYEDILTLRRYLRIYVLSNTFQKVENRLKRIKRLRIKYKHKKKIYNLITSLIKYKDNIFAHLKIPYLPTTNNQLENLIKQYERRLKTIEGFGKNQKATEGYLNLMGIYQCFKPHTDCRSKNKYKNGKSPLELAGVSIKGLDWVGFA